MAPLILVIIFSLFWRSETVAQIYKYVDEKGGVHFTDTPTDKKFKDPNQTPEEKQSWADPGLRRDRFNGLLSRTVREIDNPRRGSRSKEVCLEAVRLLQQGMEMPASTYDPEILKTIEKAVFGYEIKKGADGKEYFSHGTQEAFVLLDKARVLMGMPETADYQARKQKRKLEDQQRLLEGQIHGLQGDMNVLRGQVHP